MEKDNTTKPPPAPVTVSSKPSKSKREAYIDKLAEQLKKWDRDLEEFEKKSEEKFSSIKHNLAARLEKFESGRREFERRLKRLKEAGEEAFLELKEDLEKLGNDIKMRFRSIARKLKSE